MKGNFQLILFVMESNANRTNWDFPFIRQVGLLMHPGGGVFGAVLGRYWARRNWKRILEKARVGFGRTEVSVRLDGIDSFLRSIIWAWSQESFI